MESLHLHLSYFQPYNPVPACCLRFLFLVMILWLASPCEACEEQFKCGSYVFGYPFGSKNSGCGDPALQLDCDYAAQMPLLDINGRQYYIKYPHTYVMPSNKLEGNSNHNMTLIDKNLQGDKCNPSWSNSTAQFWSNLQFHVRGEYENLTLLQQCAPETIRDLTPLECNSSWFYSSKFDSGVDSKCELRVVLPVNILKQPIHEQIQDGFRIGWNVSENCTQCDSNGGRCAYDNRSMEFYCGKLCANNCPSVADKSKTKTIIIAGSSIGSVALVAAAVMFCIFYLKKRKPPLTRGDFSKARPGFMMGSLSIFPYQELEQATNCFNEKNELGDGGFGAVYLGKLQDGRAVAVKKLYENSRRVEQFINEVQILSSLSHPNLVRLYGCTYPESPTLLLVYEFVANGTLSDHLHGSRRSPRGLSWGTRLNIATETAQALAYLHSIDPPIFHRDVKSNNILLDENFRAKVADFGLSRSAPVNVSHITTAPQGTLGYVDPEYHQRFQLTDKSDVYSFGVVLMELISAKAAVDTGRNSNEISLAYMAIDKIRAGALGELVDPDLKIEKNHEVKVMVGAVAELAFECLAKERDFRPGMKEVVYRLQEIKQLQESEVSSKLISASPISVQEKWPSEASDQSLFSC